MTMFENSWGYKCPVPLENIPDGVKFITAELGEGSGCSTVKILVRYFVDKPYSFVSMRNRPCIRIDEIKWSSHNKSCYEVVIEGDFLQVALSVINNGYEPFFGKCIWEVPVYKLETYKVKQFVSIYHIEAVGVEIVNKDIAKMLIDELPMYALRSILRFEQEDYPDSFDKTTKVITCSVKI